MNLREKFFEFLGRTTAKRYWLILLIGLIITIIFGALTEKLRMDMSWVSMAPQKSSPVLQLKKIMKNFGGSNPIIIAINGNDPEKLKHEAKALANNIRALKKDIKTVNYKIDSSFVKKYGLLLQKKKNLNRINRLLTDFNLAEFYKNLNNDFEKEYVEESDEPLAKQENNAVQSLDSLKDILYAYKKYLKNPTVGSKDLKDSLNKFSFGDEYFFSPDKKMLLLFVQPYVSVIYPNKMIPVVRKIEKILNNHRKKYPDMKFGQTGMGVISRDEMDAGMHDTYFNLITAAIAILILLALSFRMFTAPFLAMISLLLGIIWDLGIAYIFIGRLNLMTAMVGVILIGLGIDYSIHLITGFTQSRYKGLSLQDALIESYKKVGPGILTGALTTAVSFLVFIVSDINMMKELGFVMGIGIITTFLSSLFILPSLIVAKEKIQKIFKHKKLEKKIDMEYKFMGKFALKVVKIPYIIISIVTILTIISLILIPKLHFDSDFRKLEARGLISLDLMDKIAEKYDMSTDPVVFTTTSLKEAEKKTDKLNKMNSVGFVDSISIYLPSKEKQINRFPVIKKIRQTLNSQPKLKAVKKTDLIKQIKRLEANIIEIGDMAYMGGMDKLLKRCDLLSGIKNGQKANENIFDKLIKRIKKSDIVRLNNLQNIFAVTLKKNFSLMCKPAFITLKDVPDNIKKLFISNDGKNYLINVYSAKPIWKNLFTSPFIKEIKKVEPKITGMAPLMYVVIESAAKGGRIATILALIVIFLLVLIDFKNLKFTLIALIPLIVGSIMVLGFLVATGIYFTWMTVMIVPLIIGIGIDDGVHIIHRYRIENKTGKERLPVVLRTTGKAVILTSLTTMIGFGSLIFSKMVGYQQFGLVLAVGIGILLLLSTILLPAILKLFDK